jgi:hypothetical protein
MRFSADLRLFNSDDRSIQGHGESRRLVRGRSDAVRMNANFDRGRAYRLFAEAMDLEPSAREDFVRQSCREDAVLLHEVAALIAMVEAQNGALRSGPR